MGRNNKSNNARKGKGKGFNPKSKGFDSKSKSDALDNEEESSRYYTKDRSGRRSNKQHDMDYAAPSSKRNHPHWLAPTDQLAKDFANIYASWPTGNRFINYNPEEANGFSRVPGIMAFDVATGVGHASDLNSAVNVAARKIYSNVRFANSGSKNYDSPDLMLYFLMMCEAYKWYFYMRRIYGSLRLYSYENRYLPIALTKAMGVNAEEFQTYMADFRAYINSYAWRLSQFVIPKDLPYFERIQWLFDNVYTDSDSLKGQIYLFRPDSYAYFTLDENGAGMIARSELPYVYGNGTYMSLDEVQVIGNTILNSILESESMGIMSGDIQKAYGTGASVLAQIAEDYKIGFLYDEEVLTGIENAQMTNIPSPNITQIVDIEDENRGALISIPKFTFSSGIDSFVNPAYGAPVKILNLRHQPQDAYSILRSALFMVNTKVIRQGSEIKEAELTDCGTFWMRQAWIYTSPYSDDTILFDAAAGAFNESNGGDSLIRDINLLSYLPMFDWHPVVYVSGFLETLADFRIDSPIPAMDMKVTAEITQSDISRLCECRLLAEFLI